MKSQSHLFPIILMARLLRVSVSRFYDWLKRGMSKRSIQRNQQTILVKIAHEETKQSTKRHRQNLLGTLNVWTENAS